MGNWQDGITVPMPKMYVPDEDFIGKEVVLHMCEFHEGCDPDETCTRKDVSLTGNCNCKLQGKPVTITGMKQTDNARFYHSTCYTIAESDKLIHESEFSPESLDNREVTTGYIIEGEDGHFLTAGYNYAKQEKALNGYIFNTGIVKTLLKEKSSMPSIPLRAYPAESDYDGGNKKITGEALSWEQLRKQILVK